MRGVCAVTKSVCRGSTQPCVLVIYTTAPLRGRLTPSATLAQERFQLNVKGAERRGPGYSATSDSIIPRAACAELIAMSVLCCLLAMSRSDRQ